MTVVVVAGDPVEQGSMICYGAGGRHRLTHANHARLGPWRAAVAAAAALVAGGLPGPLQGPLRVAVRFTVARPVSVRRPWPSVRPDLDKLVRAVCDGITTGGLWEDDGQVVALDAAQAYPGEPGFPTEPGALITITKI